MRNICASLLLLGIASTAFASFAVTPEIDPSTGAAAITLISGAALVLRSRRRRP